MPRDEPIILHDSFGRLPRRPARKARFRERPARVSRHDVLWSDVEPALTRPLRPWDRPLPRPSARRKARTHGRGRSKAPSVTRPRKQASRRRHGRRGQARRVRSLR